jgi:hypothetical protein
VALANFPRYVNQDVIRELEPNFDYDVEAFRQETKDYWSLSGGRGYFGSPQSGSAETGRQVVAIRGRNMANVILRAWGNLVP